MKAPDKDPHFFEKWAAKHCMKPICIVRDPDGDILLADSVEPIRVLGVYRTGYAIHRENLKFGNYHDYATKDFILYSRSGGVQKRVNEALAHARASQKELERNGFYDAERKKSFSLRPN